MLPKDEEILAFAAEGKFGLFANELELLYIMRTTLQHYLHRRDELLRRVIKDYDELLQFYNEDRAAEYLQPVGPDDSIEELRALLK